MSEHLSAQSIERYYRRELAGEELLALDQHLATCNECYNRFNSSNKLEAALESLIEDSPVGLHATNVHITYAQLAGLVDNEIDDVGREIASVHLEVCQPCAAELAALQRLKETIPALPVYAQRAKLLTKLDQLVSIWRQPTWGTWPRLAGATLVLLVFGIGAWFVWRTSRQPHNEVVEFIRPAPDSSSPAVSTAATPDSQVQEQPQSNLSPNSSPRIIVSIMDGGQPVTLDEAGNLSGLPTVPQSYQKLVRTALSAQRLNLPPSLEELGGKDEVLMGESVEGDRFTLIGPIGTVVRSDRPTFRWRSFRGASSYIVKVFDLNFKEIAASSPQSVTQWHSARLPRGAAYIWQVTAIKNGEEIKSPVAPAPEARFRVLGRARAAELDRAAETYANSHLILGSIYAQSGLLEDAEKEFRLLLKANPQSLVVQKLLRSVSRGPNRARPKQ